MFCSSCGASIEPGVQFCTKCGAAVGAATPAAPVPQPGVPPQYPATPQPYGAPQYGVTPAPGTELKSKLAAGLLGIFLGWLGIHRFYLGYNNIAIAQLAVGVIGLVLSPFTCGLIIVAAEIWGLIEGIMILTGSISTDGQGRPLRE
jgi:TM2 domain-containing membrane protein YozV